MSHTTRVGPYIWRRKIYQLNLGEERINILIVYKSRHYRNNNGVDIAVFLKYSQFGESMRLSILPPREIRAEYLCWTGVQSSDR